MRYAPDNCYRELFKRYEANPILTCRDWPYPVNSVFNPGATMVDGRYLLLVRVEDRRGFSHLCAARSANGLSDWEIDRLPTFAPLPEEMSRRDLGNRRSSNNVDRGPWTLGCRVHCLFRGRASGLPCHHQGFCQLSEAWSCHASRGQRRRTFPCQVQRADTQCSTGLCRRLEALGKHIWISFSPDLKHWGDHQVLLTARRGGWWDANKIGLSPPPLETSEGWLILYHGVRETVGGSIYRLGLALLDREDPTRVLRRTDQWIFGPEEPYERSGDVGNVVFPCGWILQGDELRLYYGGADSCVAVAIASLSDVLDFLKHCPQE